MDLEEFDVEGYAANYTALGKLLRLQFIAKAAAGTQLELDALKIAADQLRESPSVHRYAEVMNRIDNRLGSRYVLDSAWVQQMESRSNERQDRLESELNSYKTNLMKEAIRVGHTDLADFYFQRGDMQNAFKCYLRTRDYCTTSKHVLAMCLNVIRASLALNNYTNVSNYVQKAESTPDLSRDPVLSGKFKCAAALAYLADKKYKQAARKLTEVGSELGNQYNEVLAAQDVATIGGLCALASFDRSELCRHVIDNVAFREYLQLCPEVRELVNDFYAAKYSACLSRLARLVPLLRLDMLLGPHVSQLRDAVRSKAIVQYTTPFQTVHLPTMANAFSMNIGPLEKELANLIQRNEIPARIDSHNKVLYARHANQRAATFSAILRAGEEYLNNTSAAILRANLLKHDLVQRASTTAPGMPGGGGGPAANGPSGPSSRADRMRDRFDRDDRGGGRFGFDPMSA